MATIQQCAPRVILYALHLCLPWLLFKDIPKNIFINSVQVIIHLCYMDGLLVTWQHICDLSDEGFDA